MAYRPKPMSHSGRCIQSDPWRDESRERHCLSQTRCEIRLTRPLLLDLGELLIGPFELLVLLHNRRQVLHPQLDVCLDMASCWDARATATRVLSGRLLAILSEHYLGGIAGIEISVHSDLHL